MLRNHRKVNSNGRVKVISPDPRGQYYDYVFILGINEGAFPAAPG